MVMSPETLAIVLSAFSVVLGVIVVFGHRFKDKKDKNAEKSKIDELNEIRLAMRSDETALALDDVYRFIDREMKEKKDETKVDILLYDTTTREYFNKLINSLEKTFRNSMKVRSSWDNLGSNYGKLGNILYCFATIEGIAGYPLLFLWLQQNPFFSLQQYYLWVSLMLIVAIVFIVLIWYFLRRISEYSKVYEEFKEKYLIDEVRIGK